MASRDNHQPRGPKGSRLRASHKDGPQIVDSVGHRWTDEAEDIFFDHLGASCNITRSARAAGFSATLMHAKRRTDPAFARRWLAALDQGVARVDMLLVQRAIETLEGIAPDPDTPIPQMTVKDALAILGHHRARVEGGPRSRRQWARPRSLDEVRDSILRKLEAIEAMRREREQKDPPRDGEGDHA